MRMFARSRPSTAPRNTTLIVPESVTKWTLAAIESNPAIIEHLNPSWWAHELAFDYLFECGLPDGVAERDADRQVIAGYHSNGTRHGSEYDAQRAVTDYDKDTDGHDHFGFTRSRRVRMQDKTAELIDETIRREAARRGVRPYAPYMRRVTR